jgi:tRNA-uridine 2-sulfurtransferase
MRVLVAMSGGVDSSVAAALMVSEGHDVVGVTLKLWGGPSDTGCCSVADVDDARRVAQQLGIPHHVFNFSEDFERHVVGPYVADHASGRTPNPCVECNRHLKFDRLLERAETLDFDAVATGHYAQVIREPGGHWSLRRGVDHEKDQSYVLHMLGQRELARVLLPVGSLTKAEVRERAAVLGLRTAAKPDSQDVCFISRVDGREAFLGTRIPLRPARVVDHSGAEVGTLPAVELVTVGQRRGIGAGPGGERRYVLAVDQPSATVTVGPLADLMVEDIAITETVWVSSPPDPGEQLEVQMSAHGCPVAATWSAGGRVAGGRVAGGRVAGGRVADGRVAGGRVVVAEPVRRVAAGQSVVLYRGDTVVGGGLAA